MGPSCKVVIMIFISVAPNFLWSLVIARNGWMLEVLAMLHFMYQEWNQYLAIYPWTWMLLFWSVCDGTHHFIDKILHAGCSVAQFSCLRHPPSVLQRICGPPTSPLSYLLLLLYHQMQIFFLPNVFFLYHWHMKYLHEVALFLLEMIIIIYLCFLFLVHIHLSVWFFWPLSMETLLSCSLESSRVGMA